jgi:superoxide dismutase
LVINKNYSFFLAVSKSACKRWSYQGDLKREDMADEQLALKYFDITKEYIDKLKLTIKELQKKFKLSSEKCHKTEKPLNSNLQFEVFNIFIFV